MFWQQYCYLLHINYYLQLLDDMNIKIIAFGQIAEITGKEFYIDVTDTATLRSTLNNEFPDLAGKKYAIAVNKKIITDTVRLAENDTVALMPPYSGG
jgi:sulfur-carrier protein